MNRQAHRLDYLLRSPHLEVRHVPAGDGRRIVVTFDSYHEPPGFGRPGFGEAFFEAEGISAIHVMCHGNDWFQYTEMAQVLERIRRVSADAERVMTYGSSMGGYAALRFAAAVGAQSALALSPQYSLHPRKAPFETRWASDRRRIRFIPLLEQNVRQVPSMILAYDPRLDPDRCHALRFAGEVDITLLPLPFAGHPVGAFLNDVGLLRPLVLDALGGSFDPAPFLAHAAAGARRSAHWLGNVADRHPRASGSRAVSLAERAVLLAPGRPNLEDIHARALARVGRYEEAIAAHERALAIEPIPDYLWGLSKTLAAAGDPERALEVADRIRALAPRAAGYHAWAAQLHETLGQRRAALNAMRHAIRHDPRNLRYRAMAAHLRWTLFVERARNLLRQ